MTSEWHARGTGQGAYVEVFCQRCSRLDIFENVTLNATFRHCGRLERIPEKVYEQYMGLREVCRRPVVPASVNENRNPWKLLQWI